MTNQAASFESPSPISVEAFLSQHPDLMGLPLDQLDELLLELLPKQPISYYDVVDGISLVKGLLGQSLPLVSAHLALLMQGEVIIGLICVNTNDELPGERVPDYLKADDLDTRYLISRALKAGATGLLLVSTLNQSRIGLEAEERTFVNALGQTLELVDIDQLDWLLLTDTQTSSWLTSDQTGTQDTPQIDWTVHRLANATAENSPSEPQPRPAVKSAINLTLGVWESPGRLSEVELIYWALECSKESYKKTMLDEDSDEDEVEEADWHFTKMQEIQNGLFGLVAGLASDLSKTATGLRS